MNVTMLHSTDSETAVCKGKAGNALFGEFACWGGVDGSVIPRHIFETDIEGWKLFGCNRGGSLPGPFKHTDGAKAAKHKTFFLPLRASSRSYIGATIRKLD
jgi:hypothetical protein